MEIRLIDARRSIDKSQSQVSNSCYFKAATVPLFFCVTKYLASFLRKKKSNIRDGVRVNKKISVT